MSAFHSLAPCPPASLETVHNILGSLVARYRQEEVLTAIRQIPARDAKFRPVPAWMTSALAEAYQTMGIRELYLHQASTAELQHHQSGAEELTNIFVDRWQSLYRIAMRQLENVADAEDAVQDAFLSAYTHLNQFKRQARMSTWVTTIVINSARLKLRRRPRKVHIALNDQSQNRDSEQVIETLRDRRPNPEELSQRNELAERAGRFTLQISPTLRKTFQLRHVYGLSIRDTAKLLGIPNGTVKAQTARARAKLKLLMQNSTGRKRKQI